MTGGRGTDRSADLALALRLADRADEVSLPRFGAGDLQVSSKPDLTPVSDADLAVERALRAVLGIERPDDSVLGEEYGDTRPGARRRWVIDPIDGTKNFVRGVPVWATLIALLDGDEVVVGVVSAPALVRRWWGADGLGAHSTFLGGPPRPLRVSAVSDLADASLAYSEMGEWDDAGRGEGFRALTAQCWRNRGYGDFYPYMLVAEGAADIAAEPELSLWDVAALVPVVREAGGRISGVDGGPADAAVRSAVATNGMLHDVVLAAIRPDAPGRPESDIGSEVTGRPLGRRYSESS